MSAMETWDSSELPTKFNKYKRLKEREEKEAANNKNNQVFPADQPIATRERFVFMNCLLIVGLPKHYFRHSAVLSARITV